MSGDRYAFAPQPWWYEPGPEECDHCAVAIHGELAYHCSVCDDLICVACVLTVIETRKVFCPHCDESSPE